MKLLSFIKSAFAKMNEMLNKAWKWVGDFLVDTMTGEILETSCGMHMPTHKYTWSERVFFAAKATIFGAGSAASTVSLRDSWLKGLVSMGVVLGACLVISAAFTLLINWVFATSISIVAFLLIERAINFILNLVFKSNPGDYYERIAESFQDLKSDIASMKASKASA